MVKAGGDVPPHHLQQVDGQRAGRFAKSEADRGGATSPVRVGRMKLNGLLFLMT